MQMMMEINAEMESMLAESTEEPTARTKKVEKLRKKGMGDQNPSYVSQLVPTEALLKD